jgi:hypothetical protein
MQAVQIDHAATPVIKPDWPMRLRSHIEAALAIADEAGLMLVGIDLDQALCHLNDLGTGDLSH